MSQTDRVSERALERATDKGRGAKHLTRGGQRKEGMLRRKEEQRARVKENTGKKKERAG